MSVALPIEEDPRFRRYTASAGQKVFSIPFPFQQAEDVVICLVVDGIYTEVNRSLFEISGAMAPDGGSITFAVGRSAGEVIAIIGSAILERLSSIARDGRFASKLTDDELDRNRIIQQEQRRDIGRAIKAPYGSTGGTLLTTTPSSLLHVDERGNLVASETPVNEKTLREIGDLALASLIGQAGDIEVPMYDTRLAVTFADIKPTVNTIRTGGYAAPGDGGAALYKRVATEPTHAGKVQSADGAWWEMAEEKTNAAMLGATNGSDITQALASGVAAFPTFEVQPGSFKHPASTVLGGLMRKVLKAEPRTSFIYNDDPATHRNLINFYSSNNVHISGLDINQAKTESSHKGHGLVLRDSNYITVADLNVTGIGGEGTGIISYGSETSPGAGTYNKTRNVNYRDIYVQGNRNIEVNTNGAIIVDSAWSGMSRVYARDIGQFPAEFKGDCKYGYLSDVLIENCRTGLYHGSVSDKHPSYIASANVVVQGADFGVFSGLGTHNAYSNIIVDFTGTSYAAPEAVRHNGSRSSVFGVLTAGSSSNARGVSYRAVAENNYTSINAQHQSACIVQVEPGARRNATEVVHAWERSSLLNAGVILGINNVFSSTFGEGNPVYSHAMGEYLGNLSGAFKWYDSLPTAAAQSSDLWRYGSSGKNSRLTLLGDDGYTHGFGVSTPSMRGDLIFNSAQSRWQVAVGSVSYFFQENTFYAGADAAVNLGAASQRWKTVYAETSTINTSDAREKDWRGALNDEELRVAKRLSQLIGIYRWKTSIEEKGDLARLHAGVLAQDVIAAFDAEGLDPFVYGLVCYDEWPETPEIKSPILDEDGNETGEFDVIQPYQEAGNRYGVRYDELWAFVAAGFEARLSSLEDT